MPTTYRHFRCPDELWKPVAAIAAEVSPDRGVSGLIIDFFQALVAGTREPFPHVKSEADGVDEINPEVWKLIAAAIAPAVTHEVHMAVKRALKKMENLGLSVICHAVMEGDEVAAYQTVMAGTQVTAEADADLIAHAPTDLALLLTVVDAAKVLADLASVAYAPFEDALEALEASI